MNEEMIADTWMLFKEYVDKKQLEVTAEKFVDMLADYGISDHKLEELVGTDSVLDAAIHYYLDNDDDDDEVNDEDW